jgi:hypothetical protein
MTTEAGAAAGAATEGGAAAGAGAAGAGAAAGGTTAFDWKAAGLDEAQLGYVQNKQFKDPAALASAYVNLEKLARGDQSTLLRLPTTDEPAAWDEVHTRLGRPKTPGEYSFKAPDGADPKFAEAAKAWFHEAGVSDKAAAKIVEKWNAHTADLVKAQETAGTAQVQQEEAGLKIEWGAAFNANTELAKKAAQTFGLDADTIDALQAGMGYGKLMKFMHNLGSRLGVDDKIVMGADGKPGFHQATPAGAKARIAELRADAGFAKKIAAGDAEALTEWRTLHQRAYP